MFPSTTLRDGGGNSRRESPIMSKNFETGFLFDLDGAGGAAPTPNSDGAGPDTGQAGNESTEKIVTFKQSELDKSFAERAKRAADKAIQDLLGGLGVKSAEEIRVLAKKAREMEAAQLNDQERSQKALADSQARIAELEAQNAKTVEESKTLRVKNAVELAAIALKFHRPDEACLYLDIPSFELGEDGKVKGIESALKLVAKERTYLVGNAPAPTEIDATKRSNTDGRAMTDDRRREIGAIYGVNPAYIK